jgi:uncharacterized protein YdeI (YjbR/CyaY-like superfamily)
MARLAPHDIVWFESPVELHDWLVQHHETEPELWVGMRPKASGMPTVSWPEIVDEVLCVGWIDSVRMPAGGGSCIRITPRRPGSVWSARNVGRVAVLRVEGRMLPAGEAAFALRRDDRTAIYSFEREPELDGEAEAAIRDAGGWAFWEAQPRTYRRAAAHWVISAKRPTTRARRVGALVAACAARARLAELSPRSRPKS